MQGCPYIDKNMYLESQPERYKGFLSSDFSKTDEFSNTIRTEQYRDQLKVGALLLQVTEFTNSIPALVLPLLRLLAFLRGC